MLGPFERSNSILGGVKQAAYLFRLPPRVAAFYIRAVVIALRRGDRRSLGGSTRPRELAALLRVAKGRKHIVEIGTGTAWTSIALLVSDQERQVVTYDPLDYEERHLYIDLLDTKARSRLRTVAQLGDEPVDDGVSPELVFIDSSHERDDTVKTFRVWAQRLAPGGLVAFHDYGDPAWPEVSAAVEELGLVGSARGYVFVWSGALNRAARLST
jgi:SAM-dependent methyltransferase